MGFEFADWIGYAASIVVLVSFLMKNIKYLRMVNMVGCSLFVGYGFALDISWPIVITNCAIMLINLYYLLKLQRDTPKKEG